MSTTEASWRNLSPGDLSIALPEVLATNPLPKLEAATSACRSWAATPLSQRMEYLRNARDSLLAEKESLAHGISLEMGKPLCEALGEIGAVIAKFDLSFADAEEHLRTQTISDGPHPAEIRRKPRGVSVVVGPFNFPLHLGHGATVAYLLAGNPVIFKPSPLAGNVAARYSEIMNRHLPEGVFNLVQGGASEARALCIDPNVRSICFTGSLAAGRALAVECAQDPTKDLALELGGRNAVIVCADANLQAAADATADGMCLTCGQRCNATSRALVDKRVANDFQRLLLQSLERYQPGHPLDPATKLGPLVSAPAVERYASILNQTHEWLLPGKVIPEVDSRRGYYVTPAVRLGAGDLEHEPFSPILDLQTFENEEEAILLANSTRFGLTTSLFTASESRFRTIADAICSGNIYANLPTTFSPSTLPFGGFGLSGNGHPAGRGFIRFTTQEQAIQIAKGSLI